MTPKPLPLEEALAALPDPSSLAARDALAAVCGPLDVQTLTPVLGGASGASIFRVDTGSERYLLRVEGAVGPMFRRNPHRFRAEQVAAEAGIAPRVHHVNAAAGVMVTQFIDRRPLASFPGGRVALAGAVGELLRRLQTMSPAIPELVEYPDFVSGMLGHVRASGLFAPGLLDRHVERLSELRARAPWDPNTLVSSHNDVTARNACSMASGSGLSTGRAPIATPRASMCRSRWTVSRAGLSRNRRCSARGRGKARPRLSASTRCAP